MYYKHLARGAIRWKYGSYKRRLELEYFRIAVGSMVFLCDGGHYLHRDKTQEAVQLEFDGKKLMGNVEDLVDAINMNHSAQPSPMGLAWNPK